MGMSNYIPSSALTKAGVCTSSTRPASPYDGQVIYETDTDRTLVWNGSAWVFLSTSTANPVGLEYINTLTMSGVTTGSIDSVFSSTYLNYRLVISSSAASANCSLLVQMRSGGSAYTTGDQRYGLLGINMATGAADNANSATQVGIYVGNVPTTAGRHIATVDISNPYQAVFTTFNIQTAFVDAGGYLSRAGGGVVPTTSQYDGFQILATGSATVTLTCRIYGYRNS